MGKSWNDIHKKEKGEPSPGGGQDWKTLRSKIFARQNPTIPPSSPTANKKEDGEQLESLRTREEYGQPAEGEDSLLKSFRNVGKAPRLLQRARLCSVLMKYFLFFFCLGGSSGAMQNS